MPRKPREPNGLDGPYKDSRHIQQSCTGKQEINMASEMENVNEELIEESKVERKRLMTGKTEEELEGGWSRKSVN